MPTERFYVLFDEGRWSIKYHDRRIGPYSSKQEAIDVAMEAAVSSGCTGHETEVLVQDPEGGFRRIWTYGEG